MPPSAPNAEHGTANQNPPGLGLLALVREDLRTHDGKLLEQGFWALAVHRFGNWRMSVRPKLLRAPFSIAYKALYRFVEWTCGISLPYTVRVGRRVRIWHHGGMILHAESIGDEAQIRQNTTFGVARTNHNFELPQIGPRADIGVGACVLGSVRVGEGAVIGANAVVLQDIPDGAVAVGLPAKVIKTRETAPEPAPPAEVGDLRERVGVVAIGRNEGERLRACLASLAPYGLPTVYVDSASSDGSPGVATEAGVAVVELDKARPMSASRARREGAERLLFDRPDLEYVFFVDGDCTVDASWIESAVRALVADPGVGAVCGRRREQSPEASAYNLMCDHEWDTPVGECDSVGGDSVFRVKAYQEAGGFDPSVPAGEEPELCQRVRRAGWALQRIDAEMTVHDAAMTSFAPWWRRQVRTGYSGADVEARFGLGLFDRLIRGALFWSLVCPLSAVAASIAAGAFWGPRAASVVLLVAVFGVALQVLRIASGVSGRPWSERLRIAVLTMIAKPAIVLGAMRHRLDRWRGRDAQLVEYKASARPAPTV